MGEAMSALLLDEEKFHANRLTGLGGSDAAPAMGLSDYRTALDVYLEKKGQLQRFEDTNATRWGRLIEPVLRQQYAERTGHVVTQPREMLRHPKYSFVVGHPDGLVLDAGRGWEGKTARTDRGWGEQGTDQVPQAYLIQVQHYMVLTALPVFDVDVLIGGQDERHYEVPADRELQEMIVDAEHDLWQRIQRGEPPTPDWEHAHTATALRKLYPGTNGQVIDATEHQSAIRAVMDDASERATIATRVAEGAKAMLLWDLKENAALRFPDGKALRRKEVIRKGYVVESMKYVDARIANLKE